MALYEFYCDPCKSKFEQITSSSDPDQGKCPKCQGKKTRRMISKFAVGGQGDLRETTFHGCHDNFDGVSGGHDHHDHHGHGHDHDD